MVLKPLLRATQPVWDIFQAFHESPRYAHSPVLRGDGERCHVTVPVGVVALGFSHYWQEKKAGGYIKLIMDELISIAMVYIKLINERLLLIAGVYIKLIMEWWLLNK